MSGVGSAFGDGEADSDGPYLVLVSDLIQVGNPYESSFWGLTPLSQEAVAQAIEEQRFALIPNDLGGREIPRYQADPDLYDIERVAFLVVNKAEDPIGIEVTSHFGTVQFMDGCHRFAAAIYRGDERILLRYGGYVDAFHDLFKDKIKA